MPFDPSEFEPISMAERLATALVQRILSGELPPGERIVESGLAKQVGVSQGTVREALIQLEYRGFVTRIPNRGTFVTKLASSEVAQIIEVRLPLEMLGLELAKKNLTSAHIDSVRKVLDEMKAAADRDSVTGYSSADLAFHEAIWNITGNMVLESTLRSLCSRLFAFGLASSAIPGADELSSYVGLHAALLESLIHDDIHVCQETMRAHIAHFWPPVKVESANVKE